MQKFEKVEWLNKNGYREISDFTLKCDGVDRTIKVYEKPHVKQHSIGGYHISCTMDDGREIVITQPEGLNLDSNLFCVPVTDIVSKRLESIFDNVESKKTTYQINVNSYISNTYHTEELLNLSTSEIYLNSIIDNNSLVSSCTVFKDDTFNFEDWSYNREEFNESFSSNAFLRIPPEIAFLQFYDNPSLSKNIMVRAVDSAQQCEMTGGINSIFAEYVKNLPAETVFEYIQHQALDENWRDCNGLSVVGVAAKHGATELIHKLRESSWSLIESGVPSKSCCDLAVEFGKHDTAATIRAFEAQDLALSTISEIKSLKL